MKVNRVKNQVWILLNWRTVARNELRAKTLRF